MNHNMKRLEAIGKALSDTGLYIRPHPTNEMLVQFVDFKTNDVIYESHSVYGSMKDFSTYFADSIMHKGFNG